MGVRCQRKLSTALTPKEGTKNNYKQSLHIAHLQPIFKSLRCLKITDMFSVAIWMFYFKRINNKLPNYFSSYKSVLLVVNERYEICYLVFHLPVINPKFAQ